MPCSNETLATAMLKIFLYWSIPIYIGLCVVIGLLLNMCVSFLPSISFLLSVLFFQALLLVLLVQGILGNLWYNHISKASILCMISVFRVHIKVRTIHNTVKSFHGSLSSASYWTQRLEFLKCVYCLLHSTSDFEKRGQFFL